VGVQLPAQWLHEAGERGVVPVARPGQAGILGTLGCRVRGPRSAVREEISLTGDDSAPRRESPLRPSMTAPARRTLLTPTGHHHAPAWFDISSPDAPRARRFNQEMFGWPVSVLDENDALVGAEGGQPAGGIGQAGPGRCRVQPDRSTPHAASRGAARQHRTLTRAHRLPGSRACPRPAGFRRGREALSISAIPVRRDGGSGLPAAACQLRSIGSWPMKVRLVAVLPEERNIRRDSR
jgi:hypothetical protein